MRHLCAGAALIMSLLPLPGLASPADGPVEGFGFLVQFDLAIRQIVPRDVRVERASSLPGSRLVSWRGGPSWQAALRDTAAQVGWDIRIDGDAVHLVPASAGAQAPRPASTADNQAAPIPLTGPAVPPSAGPEPAGSGLPPVPAGRPTDVAPAVAIALPSEAAAEPVAAPAPAPPCPALPDAAGAPPLTPQAGATVSVLERRVWTMNEGQDLAELLSDMSRQVGLGFHSDISARIPAAIGASCEGTYEEAVAYFVSGFWQVRPGGPGKRPKAILHPNALRLSTAVDDLGGAR
jgi:hypothetical protein